MLLLIVQVNIRIWDCVICFCSIACSRGLHLIVRILLLWLIDLREGLLLLLLHGWIGLAIIWRHLERGGLLLLLLLGIGLIVVGWISWGYTQAWIERWGSLGLRKGLRDLRLLVRILSTIAVRLLGHSRIHSLRRSIIRTKLRNLLVLLLLWNLLLFKWLDWHSCASKGLWICVKSRHSFFVRAWISGGWGLHWSLLERCLAEVINHNWNLDIWDLGANSQASMLEGNISVIFTLKVTCLNWWLEIEEPFFQVLRPKFLLLLVKFEQVVILIKLNNV